MIFLNTVEFPTSEERDLLKETEQRGGYIKNPNDEIIVSLMEKGFMYPFEKFGIGYACLTSSLSCRPISFHFYASKIRTGIDLKTNDKYILTSEEENRMALMRKFIANWILNEEKISNKRFIQFLRYFTERLPYILSIPSFLVPEMEEEIKETGIDYTRLTPEFISARCQMCETSFDSDSGEEFLVCPKCKSLVLAR